MKSLPSLIWIVGLNMVAMQMADPMIRLGDGLCRWAAVMRLLIGKQ